MDKDLQKKVTVKVRPGVGNQALFFVLAAVVNNCYILLLFCLCLVTGILSCYLSVILS